MPSFFWSATSSTVGGIGFLSPPFRQFAPGFFGRARLAETDHPAGRKALLACSLIGNLGMLGFFKYYNFFVDLCADAARVWHRSESQHVNLILPAGISFYTFQTSATG